MPSDQIDPMLFDKSYYLEPEAKAAKPYALLREALVQTDRMAVVKVALRQRETHRGAAGARQGDRAADDAVARRDARARFRDPRTDVELRPQEQTMAASLVESLWATSSPPSSTTSTARPWSS